MGSLLVLFNRLMPFFVNLDYIVGLSMSDTHKNSSSSSAEPKGQGSEDSIKCLIVEDDFASMELMKNILKGPNFNILTETSGTKGIETAIKELPDIILLDIEIEARRSNNLVYYRV